MAADGIATPIRPGILAKKMAVKTPETRKTIAGFALSKQFLRP
jgi:hypothetical protein